MANEVATTQKQGIASYLSSDAVKANVVSVVGERDSQKFISSVVSAVQTNPELAKCTNSSILSAALIGHSLNLPQSPQIGMFYLVPYNNTKANCKEAVFQLSYRGYLQLAMRSGQYTKIGVSDIRQGELKSYNPITEEYVFEAETDFEKREKLPITGYYAYFVMANGYKKELYWSKEQMETHAKKYSVSYRKGWSSSFWTSNFDDMAKKTMIRQIISKWGIMSTELENGYKNDMSVQDENGNPQYVDNVEDPPVKGVDPFEDEIIDVDVKEVESEDVNGAEVETETE